MTLSLTHSVTESVTHWRLLLPYKEQSQRLATIETFNQSDEETWPDKFLHNFLFSCLRLETCDLWDIWSEYSRDMTWPTKIQWKRQIKRHLENSLKKQSKRTVNIAFHWDYLIIHCHPAIKSDMGQHLQFLWFFIVPPLLCFVFCLFKILYENKWYICWINGTLCVVSVLL